MGSLLAVQTAGRLALRRASPAEADAWHQAGIENGSTTLEDPPGERPGSGLYLAYLKDPAGNKVCALHRLG